MAMRLCANCKLSTFLTAPLTMLAWSTPYRCGRNGSENSHEESGTTQRQNILTLFYIKMGERQFRKDRPTAGLRSNDQYRPPRVRATECTTVLLYLFNPIKIQKKRFVAERTFSFSYAWGNTTNTLVVLRKAGERDALKSF